jgi:hypothetical protein
MKVRHGAALIGVAVLLGLCGCRYDTTIDEQGGGTMKIDVRGASTDTLETIKARYTGPGVEITNATMDDKKNAAIELKFADIRKLSQLKAFDNVRFTIADDAAAKTRTVTATVVYGRPITLPPEQLDYFGKDFEASVTVPGEIVTSNGTVSGKTARWTMPTNVLLNTPHTVFSVTYKHEGAAAGAESPGTTAVTPAVAPTAGSAPATAMPTAAGKKKKK